MRFPSPHENRERLRERRQEEVADLVVADVMSGRLFAGPSSREQMVGMMEKDVRRRLALEGWREYA